MLKSLLWTLQSSFWIVESCWIPMFDGSMGIAMIAYWLKPLQEPVRSERFIVVTSNFGWFHQSTDQTIAISRWNPVPNSPKEAEFPLPPCSSSAQPPLRRPLQPRLRRPGWWYTYPSEKYEFVNWDDDIPNIWKNKSYVPNHQPVYIYI